MSECLPQPRLHFLSWSWCRKLQSKIGCVGRWAGWGSLSLSMLLSQRCFYPMEGKRQWYSYAKSTAQEVEDTKIPLPFSKHSILIRNGQNYLDFYERPLKIFYTTLLCSFAKWWAECHQLAFELGLEKQNIFFQMWEYHKVIWIRPQNAALISALSSDLILIHPCLILVLCLIFYAMRLKTAISCMGITYGTVRI